jgi:hypothetical protein
MSQGAGASVIDNFAPAAFVTYLLAAFFATIAGATRLTTTECATTSSVRGCLFHEKSLLSERFAGGQQHESLQLSVSSKGANKGASGTKASGLTAHTTFLPRRSITTRPAVRNSFKCSEMVEVTRSLPVK